jgi:tRNA pseudouridine55 synthase
MGKRRGLPINGWLNIDKPSGPTSAAVVAMLRRASGAAKVGHGGTLDPLATGILPIAFGEATKTVAYAMDGRKEYRFTIRWGEARTTDDAEGEVTATSDVRPDAAAIRTALPAFTGEITQVPPDYSAIKVDGKRAYDLARQAQPLALEARTVLVERLELCDVSDTDHAVFAATVGKGTYIRSLVRDISQALNTVGHVAALRRTRVGGFTESRAISLESAISLGHSARLAEVMLPVETALDDIPVLALTEAEARRLGRGQAVPVLAVALRSSPTTLSQGMVVCAKTEGKPIALARISGGEIRPLRVLNL